VQAGAIRALEIVKVDDGHLGVGISTDGTAGNVDGKDRVAGEIEFLETRQGLTVVEMRKLTTVLLAPRESVMGSFS